MFDLGMLISIIITQESFSKVILMEQEMQF